jgi:GntR family transcriptional regulator
MYSDLVISQTDRRPMYLQIMEQIRRRIAVGDWKPGHEIPSIRSLAAAVQVSVITVKRAYLELERDGVIVTRQGKGSFVADSADLRTQLRRGEVDGHLSAAVDIGLQIGLTSQDMEARVRELVDEQTRRVTEERSEGDGSER